MLESPDLQQGAEVARIPVHRCSTGGRRAAWRRCPSALGPMPVAGPRASGGGEILELVGRPGENRRRAAASRRGMPATLTARSARRRTSRTTNHLPAITRAVQTLRRWARTCRRQPARADGLPLSIRAPKRSLLQRRSVIWSGLAARGRGVGFRMGAVLAARPASPRTAAPAAWCDFADRSCSNWPPAPSSTPVTLCWGIGSPVSLDRSTRTGDLSRVTHRWTDEGSIPQHK